LDLDAIEGDVIVESDDMSRSYDTYVLEALVMTRDVSVTYCLGGLEPPKCPKGAHKPLMIYVYDAAVATPTSSTIMYQYKL